MAEGRSQQWSSHDPGSANSIPGDRVRLSLRKILESHEFRSSKRCQDFLRFVVESTLDGRTDILKERTIGIEAFGRPASYDPSDDATVRVKAGEVRKRLGRYYATEGQEDDIRIDLPAGGYVPDFVKAPPQLVPGKPIAFEAPVVPAKRRSFRLWAVSALLAVVAAAAVAWFQFRKPVTALDEFWAPVLAGTAPALLCAAYVPVYSDREPGRDHPQKFEDFIQLNDQFVGGGDLVAAARLAGMLTKMGRAYQVRIGSEVSFQDLRSGPAVLIGYSYTRWKDVSNSLRYFIDAARRPVVITDNGTPTRWSLPNLTPDRHTDEDYAIVSRVFDPDTHAMMVEISGITQYGTEAGGYMVTSPALLADALKDAPPDWQKRNFQLVLHVKVIAGSPASPQVIAKHFW
jgi:hypothetical protein